jgi:hypothetical protein
MLEQSATEEGVEEFWVSGESSFGPGHPVSSGEMKTTTVSLSFSPVLSSFTRLKCSTVVQGCWTPMEDEKLRKVVFKHEDVKWGRWSKIASFLPGIGHTLVPLL